MTEVWLRGPLAGVPLELQPIVHALLQVEEEIVAHCSPLSTDAAWHTPGGAASVGFHVRHLGGSLDRLLTYARGEQLSRAQLAALQGEGDPGVPAETAASLVGEARAALAAAIAQVRATPVVDLDRLRVVGRGRLPSTVRGLLVHAAEHSARHAGQILTTVKIVAGLPDRSPAGASRDALARWLDAGIDGDPWHGPSVQHVLAGVTAADAARPAVDGGHAIWELVLHITAWTREVHRRLGGAAPAEPRDGDWPAVPAPTADAWSAACDDMRASSCALVADVRHLSADDLSRPVGEGRDPALGTGVSCADMLAGLAQHHAYHGGQIARLVRGLRAGR